MRGLFFILAWFGCLLQGMAADRQEVLRLQKQLNSVSSESDKISILLNLSEKLETDSARIALQYAIMKKALRYSSN
jgi:hypothetical protein